MQKVGSVKIAFFDRSRSLRLRRLAPKFVSIRHDGPRPRDETLTEKYNTQYHQQPWWWSKFVDHSCGVGQLYGSVLMTRRTSHARCAIVEPIATMRVQNACSRIKRGSC